MRLAQLISNAASLSDWKDNDIFHCEDDQILSGLIQLAQRDMDVRDKEQFHGEETGYC